MTLSEDIQSQIIEVNAARKVLNNRISQWSSQVCFNSACTASHNALSSQFPIEQAKFDAQIKSLNEQLKTALEKELNEIKIETKLDIPPNSLNQLGELKKPENQGLLLIAGLVTAALVLS